MKFFFRAINVFVFLLVFQLSLAQKPMVKSFDIRSENTRPVILKLLLDSHGLIWAGTDNGVFTFDGVNFKNVYSTDSLRIPVSTMFEDKSGTLWVGFENGKIILIKNQMIVPYTPQEGFPKAAISDFAEDLEGRMYFSTKGEGLYCIEKNHLYNIDSKDGLSNNYCYALQLLPDQRICIGTDAGLNLVSFINGKKKITILGPSEGLPDDIARTFFMGKENILWIGLQDKGIAQYDCIRNKLIRYNLKTRWRYGQVNCILPVGNKIWVATEENGIQIIDSEGYIQALILEGGENIKANDMLLDKENNAWISESIHLYRTSGEKINFFSAIGPHKFTYIHCLVSDKNGNIWFSPDQQIGCLSLNKFGEYNYREYKVLDKMIDIVSLYWDSYGYLWFGTMGEGVFRFNPSTGKVRKIITHSDFEKSSILSINGSGDVIWVSGFNSVMKFTIKQNGSSDNAIFENEIPFTDNRLLNDYVYTVFIDSKKRIWFGTDENGVFMYDGKTLVNTPVGKKAVHCFTEDLKGRIWFSTADAGLKYFDTDDSLRSFQTKDGLSDPSPTSILCARDGNIIIVHENGFDVLDPDKKSIYYHAAEENLSDINPDLNSISLSPDSSIWIGTEKGIILYKPVWDTPQKQPSLVFRSVNVYLESIDFKKKNEFSADENNLRFDYDGLWYSDPQKVNYQFLLEGYSSKWENTKDHTVIFPKLPHGKYVFRIRASLNSNFTDASEISYAFIIHPYFWQRLWFRLLVASILAGLVLIVIRRRESRIRKIDKLKQEKIEFQFETLRSQVNPHFLFNSFNTLITVIENSPNLAVEYVEKLSEFFRNIVYYREVNLITVQEEIKLLDNYIFIQKKRYGDNLILEILIDENTGRNKYVPPLTLQLLAENAIKHNAVSKESKLKITISAKNDKMEISNNINPKIGKESSTGMGLQNIINRYELLTIEKIEIKKNANIFSVKIPLLTSKNESLNT